MWSIVVCYFSLIILKWLYTGGKLVRQNMQFQVPLQFMKRDNRTIRIILNLRPWSDGWVWAHLHTNKGQDLSRAKVSTVWVKVVMHKEKEEKTLNCQAGKERGSGCMQTRVRCGLERGEMCKDFWGRHLSMSPSMSARSSSASLRATHNICTHSCRTGKNDFLMFSLFQCARVRGNGSMRDPDHSSSNSSLLRHLKANPGSLKPIHLQCISLITTLELDWCVQCSHECFKYIHHHWWQKCGVQLVFFCNDQTPLKWKKEERRTFNLHQEIKKMLEWRMGTGEGEEEREED